MPDTAKLSTRIKEEAQRLGFALVGISPVRLPPHEESFAQWLRDELAGELDYMKRTEALRRDPKKLVPWAASVISVGMNYYTPLPRPEPSADSRGWISRYAWGDDYHDLMKAKLDALLARIRELHAEPLQGRAFVDSGPVLERDIAGVAGLGWIGKNTHLISPKKGSWFFFGRIVSRSAARLRSADSRSLRPLRGVSQGLSHGRVPRPLRARCAPLHLLSHHRAQGLDAAPSAAADRQPCFWL